MTRLLLQLVAVIAIAVGAYFAWQWFDTSGAANGAAEEPQQRGGGQPAPVDVVQAWRGTIQESVQAVGTTVARESVDVVAEVAGRITRIGFEEGEQVAEGDVLFELDPVREESELREAQANLRDVEQRLRRARALREDGSVPQAQVDELDASRQAAEARVAVARSRLRDRRLLAPFDGRTGLREVSLGAFVDPGTVLTTLDDLSVVRVDFSVPERFLGALRLGQGVSARNVGFQDREFSGEVARIGTRIDPVTRTIRVQSEFDNEDGDLRPGMFMNVHLVLREQTDAVIVPEQALLTEGRALYAYVVNDDKVKQVDVVIGQRRRGEVQIVDGIKAGDTVVVAGQQRLRDGAEVQVRREIERDALVEN
ncbi:efflux RND transporter periplasmic adaptor subunit [Methylonatrum kenyense]|uniref:efflux RND transporter periplasmic adaptor subunit n=1 Tax=Methylonatrum kenyense TaxID=455253 RepID=UPI0020BE0FF5|nr:efflux RND transporter periplasmic adaptor subunit [Methylonatrum kenyense]